MNRQRLPKKTLWNGHKLIIQIKTHLGSGLHMLILQEIRSRV